MSLRKNLLIDFGGVLINLDEKAARDSFKAIRVKEEPNKKDLQKYETGEISTDEFYALWNGAKWAMKKDIAHAWNSLILDIPEERWKWLVKKAKTHRLFLVSNTNELHIQHIAEKLGRFKWNQFCKLFDGMYLSYEMGDRKPNASFFEHVLKDAKLKAEECTFIDDTEEHVNSAAKLGLDARWLNLEEETILDLDKAQ